MFWPAKDVYAFQIPAIWEALLGKTKLVCYSREMHLAQGPLPQKPPTRGDWSEKRLSKAICNEGGGQALLACCRQTRKKAAKNR